MPTSDQSSDVGASLGSMDLDFLSGPTPIATPSVSEQQPVKEVSLMPGLETDSAHQFDPLAPNGSSSSTVAVSTHRVPLSVPSASVPQHVPAQAPLMSQAWSAPQYPRFVTMHAPAPSYGVRWSHPAHGYVPLQAMVMLYLDVIVYKDTEWCVFQAVGTVGQQVGPRPRKATATDDQGGFQFLSSSNKGGAFDFVQDAMKQSLSKKEVTESETNG